MNRELEAAWARLYATEEMRIGFRMDRSIQDAIGHLRAGGADDIADELEARREVNPFNPVAAIRDAMSQIEARGLWQLVN